jgi:hypothetical protein
MILGVAVLIFFGMIISLLLFLCAARAVYNFPGISFMILLFLISISLAVRLAHWLQ